MLSSGQVLNGDGFTDLAVSVRKQAVGTSADAGAVQVLYGGASGLQASSPPVQLWTQDSPGLKDQAEPGDVFGRAVAGGDFAHAEMIVVPVNLNLTATISKAWRQYGQ